LRQVAAITIGTQRIVIGRDAPEHVVVDPRDAMLPRWYAIASANALKFFPIDQRGVQVSLHIPANKFLQNSAAAA
jgi:hypothetical protein